MTTTTGTIALGDVLAELKLYNPSRALPISLGDADVRGLAGIPDPNDITLGDLRGKTVLQGANYPNPVTTVPLEGSHGPNSSISVDRTYSTVSSASPTPSGVTGTITYQWSVQSVGTTSCTFSGTATCTTPNSSTTSVRVTGTISGSPADLWVVTPVLTCTITQNGVFARSATQPIPGYFPT